ncbi:MAG: hypothetical protein HZA22_13155 [Nitrospirae bacterium]|nr:hypothetical protein [Nitrospirota bacterium]
MKGFAPFFIEIQPHWGRLLIDYKLINVESWDEITSTLYEKDDNEYNVLTDGITFTVLKSDEDSELIYNNNRHNFQTKINIREVIRKINLKWGEGDHDYNPSFYVKWGRDGYRLCIDTPKSMKKVNTWGDDNQLIDITTIPYGLFHMPRYRRGVLKPEELASLLKKYGWTMEKRDIDDDVIGYPYEIEYKYFTVRYDYI